MDGRRQWIFQISRLSDLAISFGWQIAAARLLNVSEFGLVAVATSISSFIVIAFSFGGDEIMTSARTGQMRHTFLRELRLRGVVCGVGILVGAFTTTVNPLIGLSIVYAAVTAIVYLSIAYLTRQYNGSLSLLGVLSQAIVLVVGFFVAAPTSATEVLFTLVLSVAARALLMVVSTLLFGVRDPDAARRAPVMKRFSLMASAASTPLLGRQLHVTIGALVGVGLAEIGAYSAAYALAYMAATVTILGIGATTMPRLADAASRGHAHIAPEWRRVLISTSGLSIPAIVLSMAVAPSLMTAVYGAEYGDIGALLYVGISATLIVQRLAGGGATNALLVATDKSTVLLLSIAGSGVALAVTDIVLMPVLGIWGAVLGSAVASIIGAVVTLVVVHRQHRSLPPIRPQLTVLFISSGAALPLFFASEVLHIDAWVVLGMAGAAGLLILWLVKKYVEHLGAQDLQ